MNFNDLSKFLRKNMVFIVILLIALGLFFVARSYSADKLKVADGMASAAAAPVAKSADVEASESAPSANYHSLSDSSNNGLVGGVPPSYATRPINQPSDLLPLPSDQNSQWANINPMGSGDLANVNLLSAGYFNGIDTIGQTLKNANLQLRSEPAIEKKDIGPWNQSTIEADFMRAPFEIGSA